MDEVVKRGARKVYATARSAFTDDRPEVVTAELELRVVRAFALVLAANGGARS